LFPRQLKLDVPCSCGYNLRGICVTGVCPECAKPIIDTINSLPLPLLHPKREQIQNECRLLYAPVAKGLGCPIDALFFLVDAPSFTRGMIRSRQHVTSVELCFGLREYALVLFDEDADEARAALKDWNIRSSEDVGKIIFAMIKSGFILPSEGDNLKDFDSIFSLDTLFTSDNCT
jgi:uncharacterized repeat protein (TIGR04138 family)